MKVFRAAVGLTLLSVALVAPADATQPSLLLHAFGIDRGQPDRCLAASRTLERCTDLITESHIGLRRLVYIAASGVETLGGASFNLRFTGRAKLVDIEPCNGVELVTARDDGWDNACVWVDVDEPVQSIGGDGIAGMAVLTVEGDGMVILEPCLGGTAGILWDGKESHLLPPTRLGAVSLGWPAPGFGPCRQPTPDEEISWGRVKSAF